jgi:sodium/proline symporter
MLAGGAAVFIWKYLIRPLGGLWDVYELLPAFILGLIFTVVVSLLTKAPDETIMAEFNRAGQRDSN